MTNTSGKKLNRENLKQFVKLMGYDLDTLIKTKKLGVVHDLVYLAKAFGIKTDYEFVWYSVRR